MNSNPFLSTISLQWMYFVVLIMVVGYLGKLIVFTITPLREYLNIVLGSLSLRSTYSLGSWAPVTGGVFLISDELRLPR